MNTTITYQEISQYIEKEFGTEVTFSQVDEKTVQVSTSIKKLLISIPVSLSLKVEEVSPTTIKLSHGGGMGVDVILLATTSFLRLKNDDIDKIIRYDGNHIIEVKLNEITQLASAFKIISLKDITFNPTAADINLTLK